MNLQSFDPLSCCLIYNAAGETASTYASGAFGMPDWLCWLIIAILLIVSGMLSASENAFANCNKYHFKVLADEGNKTAKVIVRLTEKFEDTLVTVLVGNNIVQTLMSTISAVLFYNICRNNGWGDNVEAILSTIVMALLVYFVADMVPKIASKHLPNKMAILLAWPDFILGILLYPLIVIFRFILKLVHKIFKIKDEDLLTKEDFMEKALEAVSDENLNNEEEQLFEKEEIKILNRAFLFDTIKVSQVLTPREKIVAISSDKLNNKAVTKFLTDQTFSRFPVYNSDDKEDIIGILSVNAYFKEYASDPHLDIRSILIEPVFALDTDSVDDIFEQLNKEKVHIAMVKNAQGKIVGMITMEDILDELVGETSILETSSIKGGNA